MNKKIFILGLSHSGRTTISKALSNVNNYYISAFDKFKLHFRSKIINEHVSDYEREFQLYLASLCQYNPFVISQSIEDEIAHNLHDKYIIDGLLNPLNFIKIFNPSIDKVVFLNRIDSNVESSDQDNIALITIRDYCSWLSSVNLLSKDNWIEYNFRIDTKESGYLRSLGTRNTVHIVKSIDCVKDHLIKLI